MGRCVPLDVESWFLRELLHLVLSLVCSVSSLPSSTLRRRSHGYVFFVGNETLQIVIHIPLSNKQPTTKRRWHYSLACCVEMEFWRKMLLPVPARKPESSPPVSPEARLERYKRGWTAVQVSSLFTRFYDIEIMGSVMQSPCDSTHKCLSTTTSPTHPQSNSSTPWSIGFKTLSRIHTSSKNRPNIS